MRKKEHAIRLVNGLLFLALFAGMILYMQKGGLAIKSCASGLFVLMGLVNLSFLLTNKVRPLHFPLLMASGLLFSMLGDIFLGVFFPLGVGFFALGHLAYLLGCCRLRPYGKKAFMLGGAIFLGAAALLIWAPCFQWTNPALLLLLLAYALIISLMLGKALEDFYARRDFLQGILALGSALFFFSDLMLAFYMFGDASRVMDRLCLLSYFPGQGLLALSLCAYYFKRENEK